ncbi:MAG: DUF4376 domain-containing protein [Reyranellaceae bacterium]
MTRYAKLLAGEIVEILDLPGGAPAGSVIGSHPNKPYLLPLEDTRPAFDDVAEVEEGPTVTILADKVSRVWTARPKNADEIEALRTAAKRRVEEEFQARTKAPISYLGETWHADDEAVQNIMGVVLLIASGVPVPNPRPWTPIGSLTPIDLSHTQIVGLGAVIAGRKDALFVIKKAKQAAIAALTDARQIADFDAAAGWE